MLRKSVSRIFCNELQTEKDLLELLPQKVYNMAYSIIVGQFVGSSALASVGAIAALTNVFICIALGTGVRSVFCSSCFYSH